MSSFNVISSGRPQVLVDEAQLQQLQGESARRLKELERLKSAMETMSAVNGPAHFMAAAMALCNELASRWNAERVGLGFLKGRYVRLKALSHTEKITRHMQLVQDIEAAMEECLDQDVEIVVPPPVDAAFVYRATDTLATRQGPNAVISLPLRSAAHRKAEEPHEERLGDVVAIMTVERKAEKPFTLAEIESLRLTCDLFTARLMDLHENDRWVGAKFARSVKRTLAWALKPKHTWAKLIALCVAGFLAFAFFVDGMFKVESPFVFEAGEKQVISAPFDGKLKKVNVRVGDLVMTEASAAPFDALRDLSPLSPIVRVPRPVSVLATLRTDEIEAQLAHAQGEYDQHNQAAINYARDGKESDRLVELDQRATAAADIKALRIELDEAVIKAPINGVVFSGDLESKLGATMRAGDELFQVGQPDTLRAELSVPEEQVSELKVGQTGILKATSYPNRPIHFTVERINPVATVTGQKNTFKVRVKLAPEDVKDWMRPGIEGLAKVDVEKSRYAWIWTHRMINWVRMKLWM